MALNNKMNNFHAWLLTFRIKTLPLSVSGIIFGTAIAYSHNSFDLTIFVLAIITAILFQVLSNVANDYGDGIKGTDDIRLGDKRATANNLISKKSIKKGILLSAILSFISAICLVYIAFQNEIKFMFYFILIGIVAILSAIFYTIGKRAYGYYALGDLFVFIFFGIVGVCGTYFLYTKHISWLVFLPASAIGLLSVAVLNLNNMRDIKTDVLSNKKTIANILGISLAKLYHYNLIVIAITFLLIYSFLSFEISIYELLYTVCFIFLIRHIFLVKRMKKPVNLNTELKKISMIVFLLAILFFFGKLI